MLSVKHLLNLDIFPFLYNKFFGTSFLMHRAGGDLVQGSVVFLQVLLLIAAGGRELQEAGDGVAWI